MQNTIADSERIPILESYLQKASALELARRSLVGAPVYTIISLIMLVGSPMLMDYGWWSAGEAALLVMLGGIRVWFALGFEDRYAKIGEQAVVQFNILTAIQSLTLGVLAGMVIWQYWADREVMLTIALSAGCIAAGTSALSVRHSAQVIFTACVLVPFGVAVLLVGGLAKALLIVGFLVLMAFLVQDGGQARGAYFQHLKDNYSDMINGRRLAVESQARNEFMRKIGHDVRAPVNSIIGMAALLLDERLPPKAREYAQAIQESSSDLLGLIGNIPGVIRTDLHESGNDSPETSLNDSIQNVVNLYAVEATNKGIEFSSNLGEFPQDLLSSSAGQLEQVLANLLANAVTFTERGSIDIHSSCNLLKDGTVLAEFSITDTGIGIPVEYLETIFDPFKPSLPGVSGRPGGNGLGLPLCKGLVEVMGGEISIDSNQGEGTNVRFTIRIELDPSCQGATKARGVDILRDAGKEVATRNLSEEYPHRILIVDDDDIHRQIMRVQLNKFGYEVDEAADGEEAIAAVMTHEYDLIFMDLLMPNMGGIEATHWIRERFDENHGVRIVALTSDATLDAQQKSIQAGMASFVTKPASIEDIQSILMFTSGEAIETAKVVNV
ncbi:MAG: response regulator [Lysobacterales bacterium]|jgi:signal transduction histidine kinase/ActR/RegA family two-component response regulator